jgi:glycosyltransferase involved in cell wall biosynthesis
VKARTSLRPVAARLLGERRASGHQPENGGDFRAAIDPSLQPIIIASLAREQGITGVHTHIHQLRQYVASSADVPLLTPHTWAGRSPFRRLTVTALFGIGVVLEHLFTPAHVWWYRTSHEWFLRRALRRRLQNSGPCVVYAQCPPSAHAALKARTGSEQRVVLAVHFRVSQSDEWVDKGYLKRGGRLYRSIRRFERRTVPAVDGLVFVSSWARAAVEDWLPEVEKVTGAVIPNFVRAAPGSVVVPRADLVSVGNLEAIKNHRYLFRVLAAAKERGFRFTLDVFGEGVERGNLLALAAELGIDDQVRLCGFKRDVPGLLPGYRVYVHASYSESSSLAIMEAMGAGLPVVSSDAGALPELLEDPEQGRFWPIDDPRRGAEILVELLESEQELRRAGRAAREKFRSDYDADVVAPRLVAYLQTARPAPTGRSQGMNAQAGVSGDLLVHTRSLRPCAPTGVGPSGATRPRSTQLRGELE